MVIQVIGGSSIKNKDLLFKGERILQPYSFETNPNFSLRIPQNLQQILIKFDDVNRGY